MAKKFAKRFILPLAIFFWVAILISNLFSSQHGRQTYSPAKDDTSIRVPITHPFRNYSENTGQPWTHLSKERLNTLHISKNTVPPAVLKLTAYCFDPINKFTNHLRLPNLLYNISMKPRFRSPESRTFWNPTIFALPYWAKNQYLIVSMVYLKDRGYRANVVCEANICHPRTENSGGVRERMCTDEDLDVLGSNGGLRCENTPIEVNVPPTPAESCQGDQEGLADIAGFHDPRIFYSGRGEPILMLSSQSRYACIGLWSIDLRSVYSGLGEVFSSSPKRFGGPLKSYPVLTELTRNPPETRRSYEKNWFIFSPTPSSSYVHYELTSSKRTFAKLIGSGFTTANLTDPNEISCLVDATPEEISLNRYMANATWHQATPALKLILCTRSDTTCISETPDTVFIAAIHRKHKNHLDLPIRYERYFIMWAATPPFSMLAISQHPILFANETTTGWTAEESWDDNAEALLEGRRFWAKLTYTTTIAYAWSKEDGDIRNKGTGFLDDEVILSVGVDDHDQVYGRVVVSELLQCLRICPGLM
ncbi:hypothetical protein SBOR_9056 [Sclerotinia borealis F-4128]|uniref:Uncharacterized protein n=1 Tax=Sclerotinia borealis (strain F-4128) TaxID=1432307 RepID=W9C7J8_SCLBF|nr:hypothetical protein SBOR_9056 [Sclerotinia borealis F-4128]